MYLFILFIFYSVYRLYTLPSTKSQMKRYHFQIKLIYSNNSDYSSIPVILKSNSDWIYWGIRQQIFSFHTSVV